MTFDPRYAIVTASDSGEHQHLTSDDWRKV